MTTTVRDAGGVSWLVLLTHLRLHYQLVFLSPLFALGFLLGARDAWTTAIIAFLAFHVFLYGGITAYNSYYDRDEGPVGGLRSPPPVTEALLAFSVVVQLVGALMALYVGTAFALLYAAIAALSVAYSHPRLRWKSRPIGSLLVVAFGQGTAGFAAGFLASGAAWPPSNWLRVALGAAVATLATVGIYPLTQLYQIEEDASRGDRTFAVEFGPDAAFSFSLVCVATAGVCLVALLGTFGVWDAVVGALGFSLLVAGLVRWRVRFRHEVEANFKAIHVAQSCVSLATLGYVALRLLAEGH
jgi:1,4-dihydroxy-2-naphthoate octaprenyltransferase